jgi:tetratricopeptide (TPR) repeat protein
LVFSEGGPLATTEDAKGGIRKAGVEPLGQPVAEAGTFAQNGEFWTISYRGVIFTLKDVKGLSYIQRLLQHPGVEFHALDLLGMPAASINTDRARVEQHESSLDIGVTFRPGLTGDAGEMLDAQAKRDYKRRLLELNEELQDRLERGDHKRAEQVESEIEFLEREIARAVGSGGRDRRAGSAAERARLNVTRATKGALQKISERDVALGAVLDRRIKTGLFCSYLVDSRAPIRWQFSTETPTLTRKPPGPEPLATESPPAGGEPSFLRAFTEGTTFVGREAERDILKRALEQSLDGRGKIVLIGGAPGVGKTRIGSEIGAEASRRGMLTLIGSCYDRDDPVPFVPFVEILDAALAQTPDQAAFREALGNDAAEIARLLPQLRRLFPDIPPPMQLPPEQSRRVLFSAVTDVIARLARSRPLLFLLDDLHWADDGTLLLLNHLAQLVPNAPVLVVGTYRDSELDTAGQFIKTLDELVRSHLLERLTLGGLSSSAVTDMLRALSGQAVPDSVAELFYSDTEGNPFFVEELFRHLVEQGKLFESNGAFRSDLRPGDIDVPASLRLLIGRRLARLGENTVKTLGIAAVIGRSFTFDLFAASTKVDADSLLDCVEEAERAGLISSTVQYPEARFRFSHELTRQAVMSRLSVPRRQRFHLEIADAMERLYANALEDHANDLAHHLWHAGTAADRLKTARFLAIAAKRALEQGALAEVEGYCRQALDALATTSESPARDQQELTLQLLLGQVFIATRGYVAAETSAAYDRASILGERLGNLVKVVPSLAGLFSLPMLRGEIGAAQAMADRVLATSERDAKPRTQVWGYYLQGVVRYHRGDLAKAWECLGKARAVYVEDDHRKNSQDPGCETLEYMALTATQFGMADTARTLMREAIALSERVRKPYARTHCLFYAAFLHAMLRDPRMTQEFSESVIKLSTERSIPLFLDAGKILYGWAIALQGNSDQGVALARDGLANFKCAGNRLSLGLFAGRLAEALASAGKFDLALATVQEGLDAIPDELTNLPYLLWLRGELLLGNAGSETSSKSRAREQSVINGPAAEKSYREAIALADRIGAKFPAMRAATSLGMLLKSCGRSKEALELVGPLFGSFTEGFDTRGLIEAKALLDQLT